jgi:uncharacterized protein (TIGR02996 family)
VVASESSFLQAIIDDPEDDALRLVFADWLDENGQPERAEFIRVQIALTKSQDRETWKRLWARNKELKRLARNVWNKPIEQFAQSREIDGGFVERGFVESVEAEWPTILDQVDELFRLAPIRHLRLLPRPGDGMGREGLTRFANWMNSRLNRLSARGLPADNIYVRFAASKWLAQLTLLDLDRVNFGAEGVEVLLASPHLKRLSDLVFGNGDSTRATAKEVADCPNLPRLTGLRFSSSSNSNFGDEGLRILASSPRLSGLKSLSLSSVGVGVVGIQALATSRFLTELTYLCVFSDYDRTIQIGADGFCALFSSPNMKNLSALGVMFDAIGDAGLEALAASPYLRRLELVALSWAEIGDAGLEALAASSNATTIKTLRLSNNRVGDAGVQKLAASSYLTQVYVLWLSNNQISDAGVLALAASPNCRSLGHLILGDKPIGSEGVQALIESPYFDQLRFLSLTGVTLNNEQKEALRRRFGKVVHL